MRSGIGPTRTPSPGARPGPARRGLRWAPAPRDERAVRAARSLQSAPGESGGQGWSCCHDNPGGRGPRASGLLPGGRRRGGRGRPLSAERGVRASPRPVPRPGGGGGAAAPVRPELRRAAPSGLEDAATGTAARARAQLFIAFGFQMRDLGLVYKYIRTYV